MVLWLINVHTKLVRVKGRGGMTPLHLAAEHGDLYVLKEFFKACLKSIKDVTNQGDTTLHMTLKNEQIEAFRLLHGWLQRLYLLLMEIDQLQWHLQAFVVVNFA